MTEKKKGKIVQMLSPENYIRQKARTLPIYECWVNSDWEESGLANIFVARKHSNSNITLGLYLVDLKCLGVKDAQYRFNIPESEYSEMLYQAGESLEMEQISYTLAHNIVFAGIEFADGFGFKPHKDYTSVAQYILEEDTDDVELMEIECGIDGKPAYLRGPLDSDARAVQIIAQLERTAGPGNYTILDQADFEEDEDDWDFDDDDEDDDEYLDLDDWDEENDEINTELFKIKSAGLQFKIELKGIKNPTVWRRIIVPSHYDFLTFHQIIQVVFGWENAHLYSFSPKGWGSNPEIKDSDDEEFDPDNTLGSSETPLSAIFNTKGQKFTYIYDFGDDWTHLITLEKILPEEINQPTCIAGEGKCPPEDCGGFPGYEYLKEVLADPSHEEHEEMKEWLGMEDDEAWDANEFDLQEVQELLRDSFSSDAESK